jgi:hypothetical protein
MAGNEGSQYSSPTSLATVEDFTRRFPELVTELDSTTVADILVEATAHIEDLTDRRLAPFTNYLYSDRLWGTDPDEYGGSSGMPLDIIGSLGLSESQALGVASGNLVRHFWLDQYAPHNPELWTYTLQAITIYTSYGTQQIVDFSTGGLTGPEVSDGHCWLRLGTFAPIGSRIRVLFDGGYTLGIPPALRRACMYQATKYIMLEFEPQTRRGMDYGEISNQIDRLIAPWVKA